MQTYEYIMLSVIPSLNPSETFADQLNGLAAQGWRFIERNGNEVLLERPVDEQTAQEG